MKNLISVLVAATAATAFSIPKLTDVSVVESGSHVVTITYRLADEPGVVTVDIQTNDVTSGAWASIGGENIAPSLTGKVGKYVENGPSAHVITWRPNESWPGYRFDNKTAKVVLTAWPTNAPPLFMVVDLTADGDRVTYYPDKRSVPGGITNDMYKTDRILLRKIPAAGVTWQMGAPETEKHYDESQTLHDVTLTEDYYIAIYETTKGYYDNVEAYAVKEMGTGLFKIASVSPYGVADNSFSDEEKRMLPLGRITYGTVRGTNTDRFNWPSNGHDVVSYGFFGALRAMTGGILFDLPTEAQWEYAARAGTSTQTYYGDPFYSDGWSQTANMDYDLVDQYAWVGDNCKIGDSYCPHPVGLKKPNAFDLYDVIGNVWEACLDQWKSDLGSAAVVEPKGPENENVVKRAIRGASYYETDWWAAKSASRSYQELTKELYGPAYYGFRIWAPAVAVKP